jgi:hypothetical protein
MTLFRADHARRLVVLQWEAAFPVCCTHKPPKQQLAVGMPHVQMWFRLALGDCPTVMHHVGLVGPKSGSAFPGPCGSRHSADPALES